MTPLRPKLQHRLNKLIEEGGISRWSVAPKQYAQLEALGLIAKGTNGDATFAVLITKEVQTELLEARMIEGEDPWPVSLITGKT